MGTCPNQLLTPGVSLATMPVATGGPAADAVAAAATQTPSEPRASQRAAGSYVCACTGVHCNRTRARPSLHKATDLHDETGTRRSVSERAYS
jgi:hypothetical protein